MERKDSGYLSSDIDGQQNQQRGGRSADGAGSQQVTGRNQ